MNHGSILQASKISSLLMPMRRAWPTTSRRSGVCLLRRARSTFQSSPMPSPSISTSSRPLRPDSSERRAFCRDSAKVRPMAMDSPTDFMEVLSKGSAPGNFSKAKRGTFVTT